MSWYLTIRSDTMYSRSADTGRLVAFLAAVPELRQNGPATFASAHGSPWTSVVFAACDLAGSYASDGTLPTLVNVVELICSDACGREWYDLLAGRIARFLEWEAWEDHAGRRVWPPAG